MISKLESAGSQPSQAIFPIRTVSNLTGVNAVTLRAWERRYGLLHPLRTAKGHRLYSQEDIDLIHWVVDQLKQGVSISLVKQMIDQQQAIEPNDASSKAPDHVWAEYQSQMVNALARFDEPRLDSIYNEALSLYPIDIVTNHLTIPTLKIIGLRWEKHEGLVAEEHFFCTYIRNKIGARFHHQWYRNQHNGKLICACLPGEYHEIGLLLFCLVAIELDYHVTILGANTPLEELPIVLRRTQADAIVLSGTSAINAEVINNDLEQLTKASDVPVFIGGRASSILSESIIEAGGIPLGHDIPVALKTISRTLFK